MEDILHYLEVRIKFLMLSMHSVLIWVLILLLVDKLSGNHASNVHSMVGLLMVKMVCVSTVRNINQEWSINLSIKMRTSLRERKDTWRQRRKNAQLRFNITRFWNKMEKSISGSIPKTRNPSIIHLPWISLWILLWKPRHLLRNILIATSKKSQKMELISNILIMFISIQVKSQVLS